MCGLEEKNIQSGLEFVFAEKEGMSDKEKQNAVHTHLKQVREYYNGYKFGIMEADRIYSMSLCLEYLHCLLTNRQLQLVDSNNDLNRSFLTFLGKHGDSSLLLAELLENKQTLHVGIHQSMYLFELAKIDSQDGMLNSLLFYFGALTFADQQGHLCISNAVVNQNNH